MSRAIDFEITRQALLHSQGRADEIVQETRQWEEGAQVIANSFTLTSADYTIGIIYFVFLCALVTFLHFRKRLR